MKLVVTLLFDLLIIGYQNQKIIKPWQWLLYIPFDQKRYL